MSEFWKRKMRTYFNLFDFDKDGFITEEEVAGMGSLFADVNGATPEKKEKLAADFAHAFKKLMKAADINDNGLTVPIFIESLRQQRFNPELIVAFVTFNRGMFELMDVNQDGYLQPDEHKILFRNQGVPEGTFDNMQAFDAMDVTRDGRVSFDEYIAAFFDFLFSQDESSPNKFFFGPLVA